MKSRKKTLRIIIGVAAILLLAAIVVHLSDWQTNKESGSTAVEETPSKMESPQSGERTSSDARQIEAAPESTHVKRDESGQTLLESGIAQDADSGNAIYLDKAAREYDRNGQVGDPPKGWKADYSHWDSRDWGDLENLGVPEDFGTLSIYQPTEEARQRAAEIRSKISKAGDGGLLTKEPKDGYIRWVHSTGKGFPDGELAVYVAPDFIEQYRAFLDELEQINRHNMREVPGRGPVVIFPEISLTPEYSKVAVRYYRSGKGFLMRGVTLPSGKAMEFVAGPPPDLSRFSELEIERIKNIWNRTEETQTSGYGKAYSSTVTPVTGGP